MYKQTVNGANSHPAAGFYIMYTVNAQKTAAWKIAKYRLSGIFVLCAVSDFHLVISGPAPQSVCSSHRQEEDKE